MPEPAGKGATTHTTGMIRRAGVYVFALVALTVALVVRHLLDPWIGDSLHFVTPLGAVAAAVWVGGYRPAIVVAILGYVASVYLFVRPHPDLGFFGGPSGLVALLAYLFTCALIIAFGEATRIAQIRANERRELLRVTLRSIGDAVVTTDVEGRVASMNAVAESLTGWTQAEAIGQPLDAVFQIVNEDSRVPVESPATRALRDGAVVGLANHTVLIRKGGGEYPIDDSAAPIEDEHGSVAGCVLTFREVTAQRQMEREKASQLHAARLLASIVESSDDAVISKSLDGTIQTWNAGAEQLFGYSAEQAIGRHISLVIPPDRIAEEEMIISSLKGGRKIEHFDTERVRSDGRRILVSLTISPIRDDAGTVIGASKIVRDVTGPRQAEQRERQLLAQAATANAKFRAFFDQGELFAAIMDANGTTLEVNRFSSEACGYTKDQIVGKLLWEGPWWSASASLSKQIEEASARAAAGQSFHAELPYFVADGSKRMAEFTILPITDDASDVLFLAATGVDVTDRKRAEAEREKFFTLVENSTDFIGMCDLNGVPFFVNRAGLELVGLADVAEARRTPVGSFFFPEDEHRVVHEFLPSVFAKGHGEIEVRFRNFKTGGARWMAYKVVTLPDAEGRPVAFATVSQDVTERRRLEENLRALASDLAEGDRRKNEFLAMLAHELRNPLAPISNAARALRLSSRDPATQHLALETLDRQVGLMSRLVDDLLDMSRITRGRIELRKERTALAPIIEQAVESVRELYRTMEHELTVNQPEHPVYLDADPARLTQVIGNLLNNAGKFTDKGGHVSLTVERRGETVFIRVRDNGIGIAAENIPGLFEIFNQVDTSLERSRHGLGIGLTLVKSLVEFHGGTVEVRSEGPGRGTEFTVRLPVVVETTAPPPPVTAMAAPLLGVSRRILIVDDNEDGAATLAMLLQLSGHETHEAHDGLQALEAAERLRPHAVLLDIGLPKLNGYEVCRRIRKEPWGTSVVMVALTGWGQAEDRHRSREAGFDAHMVKPVDPSALLKLLAPPPSERDPVTMLS